MPRGTSLAVQWLRLHASTAGGAGSIPGRGTKIPHAAWHSQKNEKENSLYNKKTVSEYRDKCTLLGQEINFARLKWTRGLSVARARNKKLRDGNW